MGGEWTLRQNSLAVDCSNGRWHTIMKNIYYGLYIFTGILYPALKNEQHM
jgi:hypothetical protein